MMTLYETCETCPPQPVTFTIKESIAAVVGVPARFSDLVVLDIIAVTPAGRAPDVIAHL
jgi:hypothetical protein